MYNKIKANYSIPDSGSKSFVDSIKVDSLLRYQKIKYFDARVVSNSVSSQNNYIVLDSIKYYNIKRKELRLIGMKFPKKEVIPMTDDEIKELRTLLRESIKVNEKSIGNKMVEMGYKLKGFNC